MDSQNDEFLINEVRIRAYLLYLGGDNPGEPLKDWLQAEQEVMYRFRYIYVKPSYESRVQ